MSSPGPIFYRSERIGIDGNEFQMTKFRSMITGADAMMAQLIADNGGDAMFFKLKDDPRVTRVGKFLRKYSIDEWPQSFSIVTGKLTLVGPRVISREETIRYGDLLPKLLSVKPGLTGYWQVMGRQNTSYQQRIAMDMHYIDHWSLGLDLRIVVLTLWKVVRAEGAY